MKIATEFKDDHYSVKNNLLLFFVGISISAVCVLSFLIGFSLEQSLLFLGAAVSLALLFNFHLVYSLFILLIFVPLQWVFHVSVLYTLLVAVSFFVCFPDVKFRDFSNPLNKSILIYLLSVIPSFYNSIQPMMSLAMFYNFIGMLVIMYITMIAIDSSKKIKTVVYTYLFGVLINSFYVIYQAISTGKRAWGFSGIFYVDFVGLATVLSVILFLYSSGTKKIIFTLVMFVSILGLILTQTRNAWLSAIISVLSLFLYLIKHSAKYKISSRALVSVLSFLAIISVVGYFSASTFSTKLEERLSEKSQTTVLDDDPYSAGENSFVTRAFIWHTAVMAFLEHPVIGIGTYSFPFSSQIYYRIPKSFYEIFVRNRTPHVTYLAVLTETGIIGFMAFIFFLVSVGKLVFRNLSQLDSSEQIIPKLLANWTFIYILISMFMTDAWLWGQQVMILGMFLGLILANYNIQKLKK